MHRLILHDCHRRCETIRIFHLIREATGVSLVEGKAIIDELYYSSGTVSVDLPASVNVEHLAAELRTCRTEVDVVADKAD